MQPGGHLALRTGDKLAQRQRDRRKNPGDHERPESEVGIQPGMPKKEKIAAMTSVCSR